MKALLICFFLFGLTIHAQDLPQYDWAFALDGYNTTDYGDAVVDLEGNTFLMSNYGSELKIPELRTTYPNPGHIGICVIKLNAAGKALWSFRITGFTVAHGRSMQLLKNGDILIMGNANGLVNYHSVNGQTIQSGRSKNATEFHDPQIGFIARYSSDGKFLCKKEIQGWGSFTSAAESAKGEIYASFGYFSRIQEVNGTYKDSTSKPNDSQINKYSIFLLDQNLEKLRVHPFSYENFSENPLYHSRLNFDSKDNLLVYGNFKRTLRIDEQLSLENDPSIHSSDAFVAKFNTQNKVEWARSIGGQYHQEIRSLVIGKNDNIYLTGYFGYECIVSNGISPIASDPLNYSSGDSFFYLSFTGKGDLRFAEFQRTRLFGSYLMGMGIALDTNQESHIIGYFKDTIDFNGRVPELIGQRHNYAGFLTKWKDEKLEYATLPLIAGNGWHLPIDIVSEGEHLVVGGMYYGENYFPDVNGKKVKLSEKDYGRSTFLYHYKVPYDPSKNQTKTHSFDDPIAQIEEQWSCISPEKIDQPNIWFPTDSVSRLDPSLQKEGCGILLKEITALLAPNPTNSQSVLLLDGLTGPIVLQIFSSNGSLLLAQKMELSQSHSELPLDFSKVAPGTYFVQIIQGNFSKSLRLVKG